MGAGIYLMYLVLVLVLDDRIAQPDVHLYIGPPARVRTLEAWSLLALFASADIIAVPTSLELARARYTAGRNRRSPGRLIIRVQGVHLLTSTTALSYGSS